MFNAFVNGMERGVRSLAEILGAPVFSYCRLETVDEDVLVADDGSLISVLRLEGSLKHIGVQEFSSLVENMTEKLQSTLSKPGHAIQVVFEYDPESSERRITEMFEPSRLTSQNLGLQIGPLLEDWGNALKRYCSLESCWLVLWTRPEVLPEALKKTAIRERDLAMRKTPNIFGCQQVSRAISALHDAHNGFLTGVLDAFRQVDLVAWALSPQDALKEIRICIAPEFTSPHWQPLIPGNAMPMRLPDAEMPKRDFLHNSFYPDFTDLSFYI